VGRVFVVVLVLLALAGCATPKIVVLSDPLDAREHNDLGVAHESSGELDLAMKAYETAAAKDRSWDQPLINLGNVHAASGAWREAAASYRQALKRNAENPEAMNNLAYALLNLDAVPEALDWSTRAVQADPGAPLFRATLALALARTGERQRALALLDETLRPMPALDPLREKITALRDGIADGSFQE